MADTTKIRTTLNPGDVIEVGPAELLDLTRQNLIESREDEGEWTDGEPIPMASGQLGSSPVVDTAATNPTPAPVTPSTASTSKGVSTTTPEVLP